MSSDEQVDPSEAYRMDSISAQKQSRDYWNARARGYSLSTKEELRMETNILRRIMRNMLGINRRLKVVDMGTGAGYAAITMAKLGHEVWALDNSENMLEYAKQNAADNGVDIEFVLADATEPPFPKQSFDIIVAKSLIFTLVDPYAAYSTWIDLLTPGGYLIIIDGNWYLDMYDEDYNRRRRFTEMKYGVKTGLHYNTNVDKVDTDIIANLSVNFPASKERRPAWDASVLIGKGVTDLRILSLDREPFSVLTKEGLMRIPFQFAIIARMPRESVTPYHEVMDSRSHSDEDLKAVAERLGTEESDMQTVMKALSDPRRLAMVEALMGGGMSVNQLSKVTGQSMSLTSHNLKALKEGHIVKSERDGKEIFYTLTDRTSINSIMDICEFLKTLNVE